MRQGILNVSITDELGHGTQTGKLGLMVFLELMVVSGLFESADRRLGLRSNSGQGWSDGRMLASLMLLQLAGGQGLADLDVLNGETALGELLDAAELGSMNRSERRRWKRRFRGGRTRIVPSVTAAQKYLERLHPLDVEAQRAAALAAGRKAFIPATNAALRGLCGVNDDFVAFVQQQAPQTTATLDMDATLVQTTKQEALFCYQKFRAFQPFNVYWAEQNIVVQSEFRDGNVPAGFEQLRVLQETLAKLPKGVERVRVRSDTAGYQADLLRYCAQGKSERFGRIDFTISVKVSQAFREAVLAVPDEDWNPLPKRGRAFRKGASQEWAEVCFVPNSLATQKNGPCYRFIAVRDPLEQLALPMDTLPDEQLELPGLTDDLPFPVIDFGQGHQFKVGGIVTNLGAPGHELIRWHRKRCGDSEAIHAIMKNDLGGGRMPSGKFGINAGWWGIMVLTLNLLHFMKDHILGGKWAKMRMKALRFGFINVAARLIKTARTMLLRTSRNHPGTALILQARRTLLAMAQGPPALAI